MQPSADSLRAAFDREIYLPRFSSCKGRPTKDDAGGVTARRRNTCVYEAPHRILDTLADVEAVFGETQHVVIARELTKLHEEFLRGPVGELRRDLTARASVRGEIVLMIAPNPAESTYEKKKTSLAGEVSALMKSDGISEMDALKRVARERGIGKSEAYRELQREQNRLR